MEYCRKVVIQNIREQLEQMENNKLIVRIENFDDAQMYWEVYEYFMGFCLKNNIEFCAKLTEEAWKRLNEKQEYYAKRLKSKDVVDSKNSITFYRNQIADKKTLILFLGTEYAEDKAGLNELFCLNPESIANEVGEEYSKLFDKYSDWLMEKDKKRLDHFYQELFKYIPKNLLHLSQIVDALSTDLQDFTDLLKQLLTNLYSDWRFPNLSEAKISDFKEKGKIGILEKANRFRIRQDFQKPSAIKKYLQKLETYQKKQKEYCINWHSQQGYELFSDFAADLELYILGKEVHECREKLCKIPFPIINDILELKIQKPKGTKNTTMKLYDSPLIMLEKVLVSSLNGEEEVDTINLIINKIEIGGIYGEENSTGNNQDVQTFWENVCIYCGGLVPFLNERVKIEKENCKIIFEDFDIFDKNNVQLLYSSGILNPTTNTLSKVKFTVEIKKEQETIGTTKYEWIFSEYDGWFNTFFELDKRFFNSCEQNCFIPYGIANKLQDLLEAQEEEDFYRALTQNDIRYINIAEEFQKDHARDYPEVNEQYQKMGKSFFDVIVDIYENGFFSVVLEHKKINDLFVCYKEMAQYLFTYNADATLLNSYKMFINAFLISNRDNGIKKNIEMDFAVVPAYHPATLEKLLEKTEFIADGVNEILVELKNSEGEKATSNNQLFERIQMLDEQSTICSAIDVLKGTRQLQVANRMFYGYGVYGNFQREKSKLQQLGQNQREAIFDEDYDDSQFKTLTAESKIMCRYITEYLKTFPMAKNTLDIVAIHYEDFQTIIAALHHIIKAKDENNKIQALNLYLYMPKEKKGGSNYLAYWVNRFFDEDSEIRIQVYLNYYKEEKQLTKLLRHKNIDLLFLKNVLSEEEISFSTLRVKANAENTKFPMIYKPLPMAYTNPKREVELSQLQFGVASAHTKLVYKYKMENQVDLQLDCKPMVVKRVGMDDEKLKLIEELHEISNWIVCTDVGIDKKILYNSRPDKVNYKMIGFSTGEGAFGEYNVTVSARESMVEDLKERTKRKLTQVFGRWNEQQLEEAATYCIAKAKDLDGSCLLKALNPKDYDMNNFLAYLLTNEYVKEKNIQSECKILVSLDAYKHWFRGIDFKLQKYPDFIYFTLGERTEIEGRKKIVIHATLIECKLANEERGHEEKAKEQIKNGLEILRKRFEPESKDADRRFWFSQLYRVLVFTQISLRNSEEAFRVMANDLIGILDGNFVMEWSGEIYTFWRNLDSDRIEERILGTEEEVLIRQVVFGQQSIKKMLTGKDELFTQTFETITEEVIDEEEIKEDEIEEVQEDTKEVEAVNTELVLETEETNVQNEMIKNEQESLESVGMEVKDEEEIDILFGKSKTLKEKLYWKYTNKNMANRHMLITGKSGQGKTYAIQCLLMEFSKAGIPAVIFDYTEGFTDKKLEAIFKNQLEGKIKQNVIKFKKLAINPFERHKIDIHEILDEDTLMQMSQEEIEKFSVEDSVAVATRLADIFRHVYMFGDQQYATIYQVCKTGVDQYGDGMNFNYFRQLLEEMGTNESKSVLRKLTPFLDTDLFDSKGNMDWGDMLYNEGMVNVIQLTQIPRDMQIVATEFILWDMWYYSLLNGEEKKPFIVVLDEAQNLAFDEKSCSNKILTEGRKFGWSGWFATQFLKGQLKEDEIGRLQQTSQRVYFRPPDNEISSMAVSIDQDRSHMGEWMNKLKNLGKGECIVSGDSIFGDNGQKKIPILTKISSMDERI